MRVVEAIPELIKQTGNEVVFGLLGSTNAAWVSHGVDEGMFRFVRTRHEATSVSAAVAYAKTTGRLGLATVTLGPGFANTVNALAAAERDHVPVVVFVGRSPSKKAHGLQDLNQKEIAQALNVGFHDVAGSADLAATFWDAIREAEWNGTPQVFSVDEAMLGDEVTLPDRPTREPRPHERPDPEQISAAVDALANAQHPLILAGWGAVRSGCHDALIKLGDLVGARFSSTLNATCFFAGHPRDLGVSGTSSSPVVREELFKTDVVLGVGASLNPFTTGDGALFPTAKIIQCEVDANRDFRASSPELGLLGDASATVQALIAEWTRRGLGQRPMNASTPSWDKIEASVLNLDLGHDPSRGLDPHRVYAAVNRALPEDRVVVTDAGRHGHNLPTLLGAQDAHSWLTSRGYASIGLGMGAAVGAAVAAGDRPVVLVAGDGGFMMSAQELDAFRLNALDVTIVVMNDEQYGSEIKFVRLLGKREDVVRQDMPDVVQLARAFGGDGVVLETDKDLDNLVIPTSGIFIIDARIDPEVNPRST